ncbi:MAG: tryptophan 7-halogenase, partial [Phycisphaeraceae bacterium]|nr:tryptophan 7-halogenase [Phycisphaeraceae bacterium]
MSSSNGARPTCDVAIIGGGPAGSTLASLIRKYNPDLHVVILEKAKFPRDHVGESQLPGVGHICHEMGCWDKVEAAGFPIKIGASYTWGRNMDKWDFDFYPVERFVEEPRPAKFQGQRTATAFQVDREIYDDILLNHAQELGADVRQETAVTEVLHEGDRITGLKLHTGDVVTATHYIDATGAVGFLKRAMNVSSWEPAGLRNIAIWEYWRNAEWAIEISIGATRVQVRSLPYGWIWFIPLGPDRTSVGLICPADYYRDSGKSVEELYRQALSEQADISALMANATPEGKLQSCKDWSHLADRIAGENWFICGEACGFADPILAAGLSLAQSAAKDLACTILEIERGEIEAQWLRDRYNDRVRKNIGQHIRFAQYWYASNGCFNDLKEHCQSIANDAGLSLSPEDAWRWLSQGGFAEEDPGHAILGSFDLKSARSVIDLFTTEAPSDGFAIDKFNVFKLNLRDAQEDTFGFPKMGRIHR